MNHHYLKVIGCFLFSFSGYAISIAQSTGPEFLNCTDSIISLCVKDEGVRLPVNNQVYLGEGHPDATSCSVHVTQKKRVRATCGDTLQYEVLLFLNDTLSIYILKSLTTVITDSLGEAELSFDTEDSPEDFIHQSGISYTSDCGEYHLIKWVITDSCGSISSCEQNIILYDCKKPEITFDTTELPVIPIIISAYIKPEDLIERVLDDCTPHDGFLFSLEPNRYKPDTLMFGCDIPNWGVEQILSIWIADKGLDFNCDQQIDWLERNIYQQNLSVVFTEAGFLDCFTIIEGDIFTNYIQSIKDVTVTLSSPGQANMTDVTGMNGKYSFYYGSINGEATIKPERNDFHRNGVSTLDLVKIQKHLLGIEAIDNPYQILAADANNSQHVSVIDLLEIRKLILGKYTEFPANLSWRFVRADYNFPDAQDPWFNEIAMNFVDIGVITFTDTTYPANFDFIGIKIGDVNNTVQPNTTQLLPRQSLSPFDLKTDQQSYKAGDIINVPIRISSDHSLSGFQFTMTTTGMEIINIRSGEIGLSEEHYALFGDQLTMSWFDENTIDISKDEVLFTIQLRAKESGTLSQSLSINSDITDAELYLANEETFLPVLNIQDPHADDELQITSCTPNPWKEETTINFYLPEEGEVMFRLYDVSGREVYTSSKVLNGGYHQHQLKSSDFADRGMMFFEISTAKQQVFRKMIVLD